jgi:hypothetical protein
MGKNVIKETVLYAANLIWFIYHPIMMDTLFQNFHSTSIHFNQLHFTPLHYTSRHFNSSHFNFTQLHFTTLHYLLIWLNLTWKLLTGMDLEGEDLLWSRPCGGIFLKGLKKPQNFRISGLSAKIRTGDLPNMCLERYSTNTLCIACARNDDWSIALKFPTV